MIPYIDYFKPIDFTYYPHIERKIYKIFTPTLRYIHAHNKTSGVRMILFKYQNDIAIYYCENNKGLAVIPVVVEKDGQDTIKENYYVCKIENKRNLHIDFFMENLDKDDIIRCHKYAILPNEKSDEEIRNILYNYLYE